MRLRNPALFSLGSGRRQTTLSQLQSTLPQSLPKEGCQDAKHTPSKPVCPGTHAILSVTAPREVFWVVLVS